MHQRIKQGISVLFIICLIAKQYCTYTFMPSPGKFLVLEGVLLGLTCLTFLHNGNFFHKTINRFSDLISSIIIVSIIIIGIQFLITILTKNYLDLKTTFDYSKGSIMLSIIIWILVGNLMCFIYYLSREKSIKFDEKNLQQITTTNQQEAELTKLRQQINPHFLFNALNSINALMQFDIDKARKMIINVSKYYRNTINVQDEHWQSLKKEIEDIQLYFEIEQIRFGHRLNLQIDVAEDLLQSNVPPLLFQPLVENAIKYGLYGTLGIVSIHVKIYQTFSSSKKEFITFEISNPFEIGTDQKPAGTGFGLNNIKKRLYIIYGNNSLFRTIVSPIDEDKSEFKAFLSLPQDQKYENKNHTNR